MRLHSAFWCLCCAIVVCVPASSTTSLGQPAQANKATLDKPLVITGSCLITSELNENHTSTFHDRVVSLTDYPARLECYVAELATRNAGADNLVIVLRVRILVLEGKRDKLRALQSWIDKYGVAHGVQGFDGAVELASELLNTQPGSFHLRCDYNDNQEKEVTGNQIRKHHLQKLFSSQPLISLSANHQSNELQLVQEAIRKRIGDELQKKILR